MTYLSILLSLAGIFAIGLYNYRRIRKTARSLVEPYGND